MSLKEVMAVQGRIFSYLKPYWKIVVFAIFFTVFVAITRLAQAKFIGWLFGLMADGKVESARDLAQGIPADQLVSEDKFFTGSDPFSQLNLIVIAFLGLIIARGVGWFFQRYLTDLAAQSAIRDMRSQVFWTPTESLASIFRVHAFGRDSKPLHLRCDCGHLDLYGSLRLS